MIGREEKIGRKRKKVGQKQQENTSPILFLPSEKSEGTKETLSY